MQRIRQEKGGKKHHFEEILTILFHLHSLSVCVRAHVCVCVRVCVGHRKGTPAGVEGPNKLNNPKSITCFELQAM